MALIYFYTCNFQTVWSLRYDSVQFDIRETPTFWRSLVHPSSTQQTEAAGYDRTLFLSVKMCDVISWLTIISTTRRTSRFT